MRRYDTSHSRGSVTDLEPSLRDQLLALDEPVSWIDWDDVMRRAGLKRRRPGMTRVRVALLAGVFAAGALLVGSAFGFRLSSVIWFAGAKDAPNAIQHGFEAFDSAAPLDVSPGALTSQTRQITSVELSDGKHTLYVSPTRSGGFCYEWTDVVGGCDQLGTTPLNLVWTQGRIVGTVAAAYVSTVKVKLSDGTSRVPDIAWVSSPVNAGFFIFDPPDGSGADSVEGYDSSGRLVARETPTAQETVSTTAPAFARTAAKTAAVQISTASGQATAYLAPSVTAGICAWLELAEFDLPIYGYGGCLPHGYRPQGLTFRFVRTADTLLFVGAASTDISRVVLRYADGTDSTVAPAEGGVLLYALPKASKPGTVVVTPIATDGTQLYADTTTDDVPDIGVGGN